MVEERVEQHLQPVSINVIVIMAVVCLITALFVIILSTVLMIMVMAHLMTVPVPVGVAMVMVVLVFMVVANLLSFTTVMVLFLPVGDFVQEVLRFLIPSALFHSVADRAGRGEKKDASGNQSRELRQGDGHVQLANQLVHGACQVTLCTDRMEKIKEHENRTFSQTYL